ncbi:MAG: hypothetical protein GY710_12220 [Desulfobacteraceae bacterium]|nr:hypothetical protein [Desulfobacteraceae bacterium]
MPDFIVKKPCRPDGIKYRTDGTVTLTQRQAKYLVLSGHLEPELLEPKVQKTAKPKKATNQ